MLKSSLKWIGIIIALVGAAYSFYSQPLTVNIGVFLSLGLIYLVVVFLSREAFYLYFAAAFVTLSYLLYLEQAVDVDFYALLGLPLFVLLYRVALLLEEKQKEFSTALDIVGHSLAILWIGFIALNQGELRNLILTFFSLSLYLAVDLYWYRWKGNPWHLMPLALTFSLLCAFLPHQFSLSAALYYLVAVIIYVQLAFFIARSQWQDAAKPIYGAGVIVALAGMVLIFWEELGWAGNIGLVLSAALFIMTMRAFRKWEFIYLMLLSFGILAHNFLRVANDIHYTHLADYIRPIIVIMGLIFLYPFLKGVFKFNWSLSSFLIATPARTFLIFVPLVLFIFYFLFDYTMVATENPYFCGSCHCMETPFNTWKAAAHYEEGAGCFACHYTPGLRNFFKGRIYGLLMVAKNFTGYYPPKSSANVNDASCLRAGCHTKDSSDLYQPIVSKQFKNSTIKFNHEVMLNQKNFGIELKCNNCHEHVSNESGEHFEVSAEVCYYCHLMNPKDASIGTAIGTCFTCHETTTESIDEKSLVLVGDGAVSREHCLACHYEVVRFDDAQYQHDIHINWNTDFTKTKIECGSCHGEIRHGGFES
jgi:nitrate/TMAO reductase-like tetraheme cytochrome c subunit